jgi:flagellar motor switch protein FliM
MSAASLIRQPQEGGSFPAMDRVAQRLARGLSDYFASFDGCEPVVKPATSQVTGYADWLSAHSGDVLIPLRLGRKLSVQVAAPMPMLLGMVDAFYGGTGAPGEQHDELTSAELRFAERLGGRLVTIMTAAWAGLEPVKPELGAVTLAAQATPLCAGAEPVLVQSFAIADAPFAKGQIACVYPLAAVRAVAGSAGQDGLQVGGEADADWSARINTAALNVRLPVRTIFARPEISFARLLSLKTGDIIPLLLPQHVPVTVAGRQFALGNIGEANGRAAIKIEKMQEGFFA